ncbi:MAG: 5-(carboxyamino)imidazole ribonucleotide synthase [Bacteroidetes bacterium]|nr:5-(carboxyamino)imidazole ribonucleotide synthase [Bacteroidota bacterium]
MATNKPKIGVIGGGQLGLMLAQAAEKLSEKLNFLDDSNDAPCKGISASFIQGSLYDTSALEKLATISNIITYETEHTNASAIEEFEKQGKKIIPTPSVLRIMQNKVKQKEFLFRNDLPTAPFVVAENWNELKNKLNKINSTKVVVKSDTGGYDGKGVWIGTKEEIEKVNSNPVGGSQLLIEECIPFEKELAVMLAKDQYGNYTIYPVVEMYFDEKANLLDYLFCPAHISNSVQEKINSIIDKLAKSIESPGLFAIELFLTHTEDVFINEIASRPHNSQHHTIEACNISQYEQLIRILLGEKIKPVELNYTSAILNIVGPLNFTGEYITSGEKEISTKENIFVHMYNKSISKPNRKLGHITVLGNTMDEVKEKIAFVKNNFKIVKK